MNYFNRIHTKFIIASGLILVFTLISFTLIFTSYFGKTITQLTNAELQRDLECEKQNEEATHVESEEFHDESLEEPGAHDESAEIGEDKDCHLDLAARIEQEKKITAQALLDIEKMAFLMALLAIVLSSVIIYYIARRITNPIINLKKAAREVGSGNLDTEIKIESGDEIGELAKAFKSMVTDIKKAYLGLQTEQAQLLASVNSLSLGFMLVDIDGKVIITNKSIRSMFNAETLTLDGITKKLNPLINLSNYHRTVMANKSGHVTNDIALEDKFVKIYISPVILKQTKEEILGTVILIEDTTQQKRLEESKNSFITIAAHELRTPISIIRGNTELLLDMPSKKLSDEQTKKILTAIENSSIRLLKIVNDFLDLTVLEEKRLHFNITEFDVLEQVNEVVFDFKKSAAEKDLYIKVSPSDEPMPKIVADLDKTREVLINILGNSIKYTEKGGITISLEKSGDFVRILISDTGIGIEQQEQRKLFQKFYTAREQFLHSKEYGSGLGLYISKMLLESMGGTIKLESSDSKTGTVFSITLPAKNK